MSDQENSRRITLSSYVAQAFVFLMGEGGGVWRVFSVFPVALHPESKFSFLVGKVAAATSYNSSMHRAVL